MVSNRKFYRYLISSERIWMAMEKHALPMAWVYVIEGTGTIEDRRIQSAINLLCDIYPVLKSTVRGYFNSQRWEEAGILPRYISLGSNLECFGEYPSVKEKRIFLDNINIKKESPLRVYTIYFENTFRIYFKMHHAAMDGIGGRIVIDDFFRILNNSAPLGSTEGPETRYELYEEALEKDFFEKRNQRLRETINKNRDSSNEKMGGSRLVNGVYVGEHLLANPTRINQANWFSFLIPVDTFTHSRFNGKMLSVLIDALLKNNPGLFDKKFQALVPVDTRYILPGLRKASNLTGVVAVELDKFVDMPIRQRVVAITEDIREKINQGFALSKHSRIVHYIPIWFMSIVIYLFSKIAFQKKQSPNYFYFSNIGNHDLERLSTISFQALRVKALPILQPYCPFFVLISTHGNGMDVVVMTDTDRKHLERFVELLKKEFERTRCIVEDVTEIESNPLTNG